MQSASPSQLEKDLLSLRRAGQGCESVLPNPKAKLLPSPRGLVRQALLDSDAAVLLPLTLCMRQRGPTG